MARLAHVYPRDEDGDVGGGDDGEELDPVGQAVHGFVSRFRARKMGSPFPGCRGWGRGWNTLRHQRIQHLGWSTERMRMEPQIRGKFNNSKIVLVSNDSRRLTDSLIV